MEISAVAGARLLIGAVPNPREWQHWDEAERLLEPARARGNFDSVLDPDEVLFAVMDGDELIAVATAWLSTDRFVEVKLIGGRDHRRWLKSLDDVIGAAAKEAGAVRMVAIGRLGWLREITKHGWVRCQSVEDHWLFGREL